MAIGSAPRWVILGQPWEALGSSGPHPLEKRMEAEDPQLRESHTRAPHNIPHVTAGVLWPPKAKPWLSSLFLGSGEELLVAGGSCFSKAT